VDEGGGSGGEWMRGGSGGKGGGGRKWWEVSGGWGEGVVMLGPRCHSGGVSLTTYLGVAVVSHRGCSRVAWCGRVAWCRRPWGVVLFLGWWSCSVHDRYSWVGDHRCPWVGHRRPWMGVVEGVEGREEGGRKWRGGWGIVVRGWG
jgi:hypothetical protein